jgi:predicted ATPase
MHYLDMLTEKGDAPTSGFADVSQAFFDASGKRIEEPVVSIETGASIRVETRSGVDHDLDLLSTGEQEALALMYFIRRAATRGGVLMIDEPEQHLHPSLQAAFLSTALELTDGAQLLMVTHSPKLLSLAPVGALLRIQDSADTEGNQLEHVSDWPGRETLFTDVGLTAVDLVQHDFIVVLEGESDESFLTSLLP